MKNQNPVFMASLERVARYMAGQDTPITKWLTRGQAFILRGYLERAGYEGERPWGNDGFRKTVCFSSPCCNLSISPLNQAGNFQYWGSIEYREAKTKKEAGDRAEKEGALAAARSAEISKLEKVISGLKAHKDKCEDVNNIEEWIQIFEYDLSKLKEAPHVAIE